MMKYEPKTLQSDREQYRTWFENVLITDLSHCEACLAEALAEVERLKWQPIETAPKDGTQIVLYGGFHFGFAVGRWVNANDGGWSSYSPYAKYATHWMPLPAPPKEPNQ